MFQYEPVVGSKDGEKSKNMKVLDRLFAGKDQLLDVGKAVSQHNQEQRKQVRVLRWFRHVFSRWLS